MNKILNLLLTIIIVLGLSGCADNDSVETRLDELELQVEALQTEMDAKDELLDSISLNIATLNENGYDDTSVLELIDSLQLWQDNYVDSDTLYDDTTVLELIDSLQLWQDNYVDSDTLYNDTDVIDLLVSLQLWQDNSYKVSYEFACCGLYSDVTKEQFEELKGDNTSINLYIHPDYSIFEVYISEEMDRLGVGLEERNEIIRDYFLTINDYLNLEDLLDESDIFVSTITTLVLIDVQDYSFDEISQITYYLRDIDYVGDITVSVTGPIVNQ